MGVLKHRALPKAVCKPGGRFKNAALTFDLAKIFLAAAVGNVFTKTQSPGSRRISSASV